MDKLIRPKVLSNKMGIGLSTLYELMKEPDFPNKVRISSQAVGFRESEIMAWIEKRTEKKETAHPTEK